ncbi:MAG: hypothetical protein NW241_17565 [Bacteroidia bacterium]|nr:hypothetical protein [Bacteroidia bacterium]
MEYRYNLLFQIVIDHPALQRPGDGFGIRPTAACQQAMNRYGLLFKQLPEGAGVICETVVPGGLPIRPIGQEVSFAFVLTLLDAGLLEKTRHFHSGATAPYPAYSGRRRMLYFSNLNDAGTIDGRIGLSRQGAGVSRQDLGSLAPLRQQLAVHPAASQVSLRRLSPGGATVLLPIPANRQIRLDLDPGAYRLQQPGSPLDPEVIVADDALLYGQAYALIEIFKDASVDYASPVTYRLSFQLPS